jgi:hypothetical protein
MKVSKTQPQDWDKMWQEIKKDHSKELCYKWHIAEAAGFSTKFCSIGAHFKSLNTSNLKYVFTLSFRVILRIVKQAAYDQYTILHFVNPSFQFKLRAYNWYLAAN